MDKTLVSVLLPATGKSYDFWVPNDMSMREATTLISEAMQIAEPSFYKRSADAALMYIATGEIPPANATIAEIGFTDGDRFSLI